MRARVSELQAEHGFLAGVRGRGLLLGLELDGINGRDLQVACLGNGLVINALGEGLLRIAPPLNITEREIDEGLDIICHTAAAM